MTSAKTSFLLGEGLVGGKEGKRFLIPSGNELEEQVCTLDVHRKIADLVDDEHPVLGQNLELIRQTVLKAGLLELFNELVAVDVVGGETVLCRHQSQGGGQMGLALTGRTSSEEIPLRPVPACGEDYFIPSSSPHATRSAGLALG